MENWILYEFGYFYIGFFIGVISSIAFIIAMTTIKKQEENMLWFLNLKLTIKRTTMNTLYASVFILVFSLLAWPILFLLAAFLMLVLLSLFVEKFAYFLEGILIKDKETWAAEMKKKQQK